MEFGPWWDPRLATTIPQACYNYSKKHKYCTGQDHALIFTPLQGWMFGAGVYKDDIQICLVEIGPWWDSRLAITIPQLCYNYSKKHKSSTTEDHALIFTPLQGWVFGGIVYKDD